MSEEETPDEKLERFRRKAREEAATPRFTADIRDEETHLQIILYPEKGRFSIFDARHGGKPIAGDMTLLSELIRTLEAGQQAIIAEQETGKISPIRPLDAIYEDMHTTHQTHRAFMNEWAGTLVEDHTKRIANAPDKQTYLDALPGLLQPEMERCHQATQALSPELASHFTDTIVTAVSMENILSEIASNPGDAERFQDWYALTVKQYETALRFVPDDDLDRTITDLEPVIVEHILRYEQANGNENPPEQIRQGITGGELLSKLHDEVRENVSQQRDAVPAGALKAKKTRGELK